jgi:hypothetical protein
MAARPWTARVGPKRCRPKSDDFWKAHPVVTELRPIRFIDQPIEVIFNTPPIKEKTPPCPDGFIWEGTTYRVVEKLSEWFDFTRRGRMARNMQPAHATAALHRGSLGVGKFYFQVRTDTDQIFDIYYDRAIVSADDRKGHWFLYRELSTNSQP